MIEVCATQNLAPPTSTIPNTIGNVIETETVEPYLGTETKKAELEPCVVPKVGSDCYKVIQWAMKDPSRDLGGGIKVWYVYVWTGRTRTGSLLLGRLMMNGWLDGWMVGFQTDIFEGWKVDDGILSAGWF